MLRLIKFLIQQRMKTVNHSIMINTALCLPAPDIEALLQGRIVAAIFGKFITPKRQFALCPIDASLNRLPIEQYYHPNFVPTAHTTFIQPGTETISIAAWARCELCQPLNAESLAALPKVTIWTKEALQAALAQWQNIFLLYLRVYQIPTPLNFLVQSHSSFVHLGEYINVSEALPILSDRLFRQRQLALQNLELPRNPELELLQSAIAPIALVNLAAQALEREIKELLGWGSQPFMTQPNGDLWIDNITALGDRSQEEDQGKTSYQAGTDFENIVRQSLDYLGFTVDIFHKGGAGGVDIFCTQPYSLIAECKAGKTIPNNTAVQLLNLGTLRLSQELLQQATKLIIGPGKPTKQLKDAAELHGMAIINPETLQKIVKLQSNYPNSVDLLELKKYLIPGQADEEVEKYIELVYTQIKERSHIVQVLKNYLNNSGNKSAEVEALHAAYITTHPQTLSLRRMHNILIELSSPLTGYLGRICLDDWKRDRFYFLRDLPIK